RSGTCTGMEVACNDDSCANSTGIVRASKITPTVTAGATYYIVVDGYGGAAGTFALTVTPPGGTVTTSSTTTTTILSTTTTTRLPTTTTTLTTTTTTSTTTTTVVLSGGGAPALVGYLPGLGNVMDAAVVNGQAFVASDTFGLS